MKTCHIFCFDHMDPLWKRGWKRHGRFSGQVIRSYSELEEMQISRWLKVIADLPVVYSIEQSLSVRNYLERNPDQLETVRNLVVGGKLELLGGGETIIDYNLVNGESIVRNHVNSIRYYQNLFGVRPAMACCTDTFGLSCQVPQIFRQLGYECITHYNRIFRSGRKYWKGLDGSVIMAAGPSTYIGFVNGSEYVARRPASCCNGEGCDVCRGAGMETDQTAPSDDAFAGIWQVLRDSPDKEGFFNHSEEGLVDPRRFALLESQAGEYGLNLKFARFDTFIGEHAANDIARLREASFGEDEIHPGVESEPVCTGCYVSRIRLKQVNRRMEEMLRTAETLAAFAAWRHDCVYPHLKLERLWNMMSLFQFHDSITGTHTDFCFDELMELSGTVAFEADRIIDDALSVMAPYKAGKSNGRQVGYAVFNPLGHRVEHAFVDMVFRPGELPGNSEWEISDESGKVLPVIESQVYPSEYGTRHRLRVLAQDLPALGFKNLRVKPCSEPVADSEPVEPGNGIENAFYKISFDSSGCSEIFDKRLARTIMNNAGCPAVAMDYGSVWETLAQPVFFKELHQISDIEITAKSFAWGCEAVVTGRMRSAAHNWNYDGQGLRTIGWQQCFRLINGCDSVFVSCDVDWDAVNARLLFRFPLSFKTQGDTAWYEVPFGVLGRKAYNPEYGWHTVADGNYAALNFVGCTHPLENYSVFLYNRGIPCAQVRNGVIVSTPLRSPTVPLYLYDFNGALDKGRHRFEYMIRSGAGGVRENRAVQHGMAFNAHFAGVAGEAPDGGSFLEHTADNAILSAVKLGVNGELVVRGYEPYGNEAEDSFTGAGITCVRESDLFENAGRILDGIRYRPNEIKTFLLS